jgi:hypothetical protein
MSKKTLLKEATIRRFWKLSGIGAINEDNIDFLEEDEGETMDEMAPPALRDEDENMEEAVTEEEMEDEMPDPAMEEPAMEEPAMEEPEMDMGGEEGDVEAEVSIPESDVEALRTARDVIDQILGAGDEAAAPAEMEMELPAEEEEVMDLPAEEEEEEEAPLMEVDEDQLNEVLDRITSRVTKRILKEALAKKLTKN